MQTVEWNPGRPWQEHPVTYRAPQMSLLAKWIDARLSGSVVGWRGSGRSNLLGFLCHRPEVLRTYLTYPERVVILVPVDLNNLPARTLSAFYRVVLPRSTRSATAYRLISRLRSRSYFRPTARPPMLFCRRVLCVNYSCMPKPAATA